MIFFDFFFFFNVRVIYPPTEHSLEENEVEAALQWEGNGRAGRTDAVDRGEASSKFR